MRTKIFGLLDNGSSIAGYFVNNFLWVLICLNVVAVTLESVSEYYNVYAVWFLNFERFSVFVFTVEYFTRIWVAVEEKRFRKPFTGRLRYMMTPMALVDLAAILPFYLSTFMIADMRILRVLRLVRALKLTRHSSALDLLVCVMRQESSALLSAIFIMIIVIVFASSGIYLLEHNIQPEAFGSIPRAMWWATVTLTTVGYGDVVPISNLGKLFGLIITIAGVGMAALPAGIIASGFSAEIQKRREHYRMNVRKALSDGRVTRREEKVLESHRVELGLDKDDADLLLKEASIDVSRTVTTCPHCGKNIISKDGESERKRKFKKRP